MTRHRLVEHLVPRNGMAYPIEHLRSTHNHDVGQRLQIVQESQVGLKRIFVGHEPRRVQIEAEWSSIGVVVAFEVTDNELGESVH